MLTELRFSANHLTDLTLKALIGFATLCLLSPLEIDGGMAVPFTLQSMLVVFVPLLFGWRAGIIAVGLYLLVGGLGLPVFAGYSSGWVRFTGVSGGFLLAFPIAALLVGYGAERDHRIPSLVAGLLLILGQLLILLLGIYWMTTVTHDDINWMNQIKGFGPSLLVKTAIGMLLFLLIQRIASRWPKAKTKV
jgi:biotin transport system substrate-specific component